MSPLHSITLRPLFELQLKIAYDRAQHTGDGPGGMRSAYPVIGGEFWGDDLRGRVEPTGMDWVRWRADDAMEIDMRTMLRTDDGALIAMSYVGLALPGDGQSRDAVREFGADSAPSDRSATAQPYARTALRFETGAPAYAWLNGVVAVAKGQRRPEGPHYSIYAVD